MSVDTVEQTHGRRCVHININGVYDMMMRCIQEAVYSLTEYTPRVYIEADRLGRNYGAGIVTQQICELCECIESHMLYNANGQLVKDDIELLMTHYNLVLDIDTGKYMHLSDIVNPFTMVPRLNHNQTMRFNIVKEKVLSTIIDACANNLSSTYMAEIRYNNDEEQYDGYAEEHYDAYEGITKVISKEMMYGGDLHDMAVVAVLYIICKVYTHPDIQRGAIFSNGVFPSLEIRMDELGDCAINRDEVDTIIDNDDTVIEVDGVRHIQDILLAPDISTEYDNIVGFGYINVLQLYEYMHNIISGMSKYMLCDTYIMEMKEMSDSTACTLTDSSILDAVIRVFITAVLNHIGCGKPVTRDCIHQPIRELVTQLPSTCIEYTAIGMRSLAGMNSPTRETELAYVGILNKFTALCKAMLDISIQQDYELVDENNAIYIQKHIAGLRNNMNTPSGVHIHPANLILKFGWYDNRVFCTEGLRAYILAERLAVV